MNASLNRVYDAPLPEVSGACFVGDRLVLVGDSEPVLAWAPWTSLGPGPWTAVDVGQLQGAPGRTGQFEAVEHLRDNTVVILCEEPALLIAVDLGSPSLVGWWQLSVDLKGLAKPWRKDPNSHGEGLYFGHDRVYVVKEKRPAAIVEFGPAGQDSAGGPDPGIWNPPAAGELTALAWWPIELDDVSDVSDVCVVDGAVWLLSDQQRCVLPMGGSPLPLPDGIEKAEGLTRTPEGKWLVAVDNQTGKNALHVVDLP